MLPDSLGQVGELLFVTGFLCCYRLIVWHRLPKKWRVETQFVSKQTIKHELECQKCQSVLSVSGVRRSGIQPFVVLR